MEELNICSYNSRGFPKSKERLSLRPDILTLFEANHIVAIQETWYTKQNLNIINGLHPDFNGCGAAQIDESSDIIQGRIKGGVLLMWRKELGKNIRRLDLAVDWCGAIGMDFNSTKFVIFNVYLPYQCNENEEDYIICLSGLNEFIEGLDNTNFMVIGDWNANLNNIGTILFQPLMLDFCNENQLTISSKCFLPEGTYTHVHTREGNYYYSWLDHVVSSSGCHKAIRDMTVHYDMSDDDHIPISFSLQVESLPQLSRSNNNINGRIKWDIVLDKHIKRYYERTEQTLGEIEIPVNSLLCTNCDCTDTKHTDDTENLFNAIKTSLYNSSDHIMPSDSNYTPRPGWNEYVADLYDFSRETRCKWLDHGKPRQGLVHDLFVKSKHRFKLALRYITKNEDALRRESLAKKLSQLSSNDFWKEISLINNSRAMLPTSIEGATGTEEIAKLWKKHFESIFIV